MANQSLSDTHDSATCHLGVNRQPCEMCAWVNGTGPMPPAVERLAVEIQVGIDIDRAIDATNAEYRQVGSVACVRAAVADVLDEGDSENCGEWLFYSTEPDWKMDERRTRFIDAVVAAITTLQSPPHNMDARLRADVAKVREAGR
jgi:hypothetical protein